MTKLAEAILGKIARLWWDGYESDTIAARTGLPNGDAVLRVVRQHNFQRSSNFTVPKHRQVAPKYNPTPKVLALQNDVPPMLRDGAPVTILNVRGNDCRWAYGETDRDAPLCAREQAHGSYCEIHAPRVYTGWKPRVRAW
jgi:hypothetical protein